MALDLSRDHAAAAPLVREQLGKPREFLADDTPRVQWLHYHLADVLLDLRPHGEELTKPLEHLDPVALNASQQAPDWERRTAYQQGRLAALKGNAAHARATLSTALEVIGQCNPDGPIAPQAIRKLLSVESR